MNGWYFAGFCLFAYIVLWIWTERKRTKDLKRLATERPNLSEDEFIAVCSPDIDTDIAILVRANIIESMDDPKVTPHPDDHIVTDLHVDDEEIDDWFLAFYSNFAYDPEQAPEWPKEQEATVLNILNWLQKVRNNARK